MADEELPLTEILSLFELATHLVLAHRSIVRDVHPVAMETSVRDFWTLSLLTCLSVLL